MILRLLVQSMLGRIAIGTSLLSTIFFLLYPDNGILVGVPFTFSVSLFLSQRATLFEAALPIRARDIFIHRTLFGILLTWIPIATWMIVSRMHSGPVNDSGSFFAVDLMTQFEILAIATLAFLAPNAIRPGILSLRGDRSIGLTSLAVAIVGTLGIIYAPSAIMLTASALACVAVFHFTWRSIPESFQLAPVDAKPRRTARVLTPDENTSAPVHWWRPIARSGFSGILLPGFFSMLASTVGGMPLSFVLFWCSSTIVTVRYQTRWLLTLPLSPRQLLWVNMSSTIMPVLGALLLGFSLLSALHVDSMTRGAPRSRSAQEQFYYHTNISLAFWERLPSGGQPPEIMAPWGEKSPAHTVSFIGTVLYNPFSAVRSNSREFREWQFERASRAMYGQTIPFAQYDTGSVNYPPRLNTNTSTRIVAGGSIVTLALLIVFLCELPRWHAFGSRKRMRIAAITFAAAPLIGVFAIEMFYMMRDGIFLMPLLEPVLFELSGRLPSNVFLVLVISALPVAAMYLLVEWQFRRSEMSERLTQQRA
jgi:hypothetical protein